MEKGSGTLVDTLIGTRTLVYDALLIGGGSVWVGLMAQIAIPLPFTPVPITGQTFGVLLVGALLGSRRGALALGLYLLEGIAGLPVFAGGSGGLADSSDRRGDTWWGLWLQRP